MFSVNMQALKAEVFGFVGENICLVGEMEVMLINRFGHWGLVGLIKESPQ